MYTSSVWTRTMGKKVCKTNMKKTGKLVGVCNGIYHCGLKECFTEHDKTCEHQPSSPHKETWEKEFDKEFRNVGWVPQNKEHVKSYISYLLAKQRLELREKLSEDRYYTKDDVLSLLEEGKK